MSDNPNAPTMYDQNLVVALAGKAGLDPASYISTICRTVIKGTVSAEQVMAFLTVAQEYGLNPILRQIYAFPSEGGIVPMVAVDGWIKKMEDHPARDGETFTFGTDDYGDYCEGTFYRKDRGHATVIREYLHECTRNTGPWNGMPRRMLRNRVICQGGRIAYNLMPGVMETDEAEAYLETTATDVTEDQTDSPHITKLNALREKVKGSPPDDVPAFEVEGPIVSDMECALEAEDPPQDTPRAQETTEEAGQGETTPEQEQPAMEQQDALAKFGFTQNQAAEFRSLAVASTTYMHQGGETARKVATAMIEAGDLKGLREWVARKREEQVADSKKRAADREN